MRMEGGTRLAFLSFYGVQNARTLVVHAAEPTSKSVSLLALDEAFLRAAVAAAGWTRGPVGRPGGGRGTARALARPARVVRRLQAAALAVAMGRDTQLARVQIAARGRQGFVSCLCRTSPGRAADACCYGGAGDGGRRGRRRPRGFGRLDAFAEGVSLPPSPGETAGGRAARRSPSVASVVPVSLPALAGGGELIRALSPPGWHLGCLWRGAARGRAQRDRGAGPVLRGAGGFEGAGGGPPGAGALLGAAPHGATGAAARRSSLTTGNRRIDNVDFGTFGDTTPGNVSEAPFTGPLT